MSDNQTDIVRKDILKLFLRTLVWIDDEIRPDKTDASGLPFRNFFYPIAQEFQKKDLLVHLHAYESNTPNGAGNIFDIDQIDFLSSATALATKSDVVLLDWHLGGNDAADSIEILKRLSRQSAIRYIVVLTRFDSTIEVDLKSAELIVADTDETSDSHLFQRTGSAWTNKAGLHLLVVKKQDLDTLNAADFCSSIIDSIYNLMKQSNSDYLYWAALEIAAKLRSSIPGWIQAIPRGTDVALLSELMSESSEARDFIPEHLLEDLSNMARLHVLDSLKLQNCSPSDWILPSYDLEPTKADEKRTRKFVHLQCPAVELKNNDTKKIRQESKEYGPSRMFVESQLVLAQFCENISSAPDPSPSFGAVYVRETMNSNSTPDGRTDIRNTSEYYVCLSQECDVQRKESLLLLKASIDNIDSTREGLVKLSLIGGECGILPEAGSLLSALIVTGDGNENFRQLAGFKKIGQLRKATARRVLNHFWGYLSRPAVNLPAFTLKDRG